MSNQIGQAVCSCTASIAFGRPGRLFGIDLRQLRRETGP